jgi:hypothetical protein
MSTPLGLAIRNMEQAKVPNTHVAAVQRGIYLRCVMTRLHTQSCGRHSSVLSSQHKRIFQSRCCYSSLLCGDTFLIIVFDFLFQYNICKYFRLFISTIVSMRRYSIYWHELQFRFRPIVIFLISRPVSVGGFVPLFIRHDNIGNYE